MTCFSNTKDDIGISGGLEADQEVPAQAAACVARQHGHHEELRIGRQQFRQVHFPAQC